VNPALRVFRQSGRDGEGVAEFCAWMAWQAAVSIRQPRGRDSPEVESRTARGTPLAATRSAPDDALDVFPVVM
jgi:hypothetical protein